MDYNKATCIFGPKKEELTFEQNIDYLSDNLYYAIDNAIRNGYINFIFRFIIISVYWEQRKY